MGSLKSNDALTNLVRLVYALLIILAVIIAVPIIYKKLVKKEFSPILLIIISALFGIILFA